jgi:hypothetical protein
VIRNAFVASHYVFRWLAAMNDHYVANWHLCRQLASSAAHRRSLSAHPGRYAEPPDRVPPNRPVCVVRLSYTGHAAIAFGQ